MIGSKSRVSEVLARKRRLTVPMIRKLSAHLEIPVNVLIAESGRQNPFQETNEPPIGLAREIVKRGWVSGGKVTAKTAGDFIAQLFLKVGEPGVAPTYLKGSIHPSLLGPVNLYAIRVWVARVLVKSREATTVRGKFRREAISQNFLEEVARLSWFEAGPMLAHEYLAKHGIVLLIEKHLPGTALDGAATIDVDGTPVIGLTLRHDRLDNFWFTLLHECAHVLYHLSKPGETFVDDTEKAFDSDEKEVEANRFARDTLIPPSAWRRSDASRLRTAESVIRLAQELKIHPAIVAGRIRREMGNYKLFAGMVGYGSVSKILEKQKTQ